MSRCDNMVVRKNMYIEAGAAVATAVIGWAWARKSL